MAIKITSDCIVCHACLPECPNNAIYEPGTEWSIRDGTSVKTSYTLMDGSVTDAESLHPPITNEYYYIVPDKCTECQGFHEQPQCSDVCPVEACVPDEVYRETVEELLQKKERLH